MMQGVDETEDLPKLQQNRVGKRKMARSPGVLPKPKGGRRFGEPAEWNSVKRQEKLRVRSYWKKSRVNEQRPRTKDELMHQQRKRIPASVNAVVFAVSFFALAMIFAN